MVLHTSKVYQYGFFMLRQLLKESSYKTPIAQSIMSTTPSNSGFSTSEEIHLLSNITTRPHSFKRPYKTTTRRYKPTKQVISDEVKYLQTKENIKFDTPTYTSVGAPPSLKPRKHYCDITGLPGKYKNPSNGLRFYNVEIYQEVIRNMPPGVDQEYLGLRGANVILK